jgi:hypothetical protein
LDIKREHKTILRIGIIVVSVAVLLIVAPIGCMVGYVLFDIHNSNRERRELLYETDHAALLEACREVMRNRHAYDLVESLSDPDESFVDPHDPEVPRIIRDLEPRDIIATDDRVFIELHGAMDHYGVIALPEQLVDDADHHRGGDIELVPGLWYHDERLSPLSPEGDRWMEKLKNMKPRDTPEPAWWRPSRNRP